MRYSPVLYTAIILLVILVSGCVSDPGKSEQNDLTGDFSHGILIVNEGLWRQDNSTLTYHNPQTEKVVQDYFGKRNPGLRIGDTGNDIVVRNDRAYIVVSTSRTVEILDLPSGTSAGRVVFPGVGELRYMTIVDDTTAFVTTRDDDIIRFNPASQTVGEHMAVGPSPEGIAYAAGKIFVANSALGALRQEEPKANTVSVIDVSAGIEIAAPEFGHNPWTLHYHPSLGMVYLLSRPLYPDSVGALVEIDPVTVTETRRWEIINSGPAEMAFNNSERIAYVLGSEGVLKIDLNKSRDIPALIASARSNNTRAFFDIGISPAGDIYVSDARLYTTPGSVLVFTPEGRFIRRFQSGLNPGAFGFY